MATKRCSRCSFTLPVDCFSKDKSKKDGLYPLCKICQKERRSEYYYKHREAEIEAARHWNSTHPVERKIRNHQRRWRMQQNGGSFTKQEWADVKEEYEYMCLRCGKKEPDTILTIDHVIPIVLGGRNDINNIQPLCGRCNGHKGNKYIDYRNRIHLQRLRGEEDATH